MSTHDEDRTALTTAFAPHSSGQFVEPWMRRVREVDDDTLAGLLRTLVHLRRLKFALFGVAGVLGALLFGVLRVGNLRDALLIYGTLAAMLGLPVFAVSTLAVRKLFIDDARRHGLSLSTSTLVLTRAERRARFLGAWRSDDEKIEILLRAVRDPDTA